MLRSNVYYGEIRTGDYVSVSRSAESSTQTRHCKRYVFEHSAGSGRVVHRGRQIQSGQPFVSGGCGISHAAILVAIPQQTPSARYYAKTEGNSTNADCGSWQSIGRMGDAVEKQRASREIMRSSLAATGTIRPTPDRVARTGTTLQRTRTTTSRAAASVATILRASAVLRPAEQTSQVVSRSCPPSGNTLHGSVERRLLQMEKRS